MTADVVFKLSGVECVESPTGDVADGVVVDNWLACKSVRGKTFPRKLGKIEVEMRSIYLAQPAADF